MNIAKNRGLLKGPPNPASNNSARSENYPRETKWKYTRSVGGSIKGVSTNNGGSGEIMASRWTLVQSKKLDCGRSKLAMTIAWDILSKARDPSALNYTMGRIHTQFQELF